VIKLSVFKTNDIRGVWGQEWDAEGARRVVMGLFSVFKPKTIAIGRDLRQSSKEIAQILTEQFAIFGCQVWDLGEITTDISYFVSSFWQPDITIMVTASHNPGNYGGLKISLPKTKIVDFNDEHKLIREIALGQKTVDIRSKEGGEIIFRDPYNDFKDKVLSLVDIKKIKPLKVIVDGGNGIAGKTVLKLLEGLPLNIKVINYDPANKTPKEVGNPLLPNSLGELKQAVVDNQADFGAGFDGDGDRMAIVDNSGKKLTGSSMTAFFVDWILKDNPGKKIVYNSVCSRVVAETIEQNKGIPIRVPVGHAIIKRALKAQRAIFAGEHSYHFFFPKLGYADSGITALLLFAQIVSQSSKSASELMVPFCKYFQTTEVNFSLEDKVGVIKLAEKEFSSEANSVDHIDGLTVWFDDWWFNLRPSGTQSLLRLNIEADTKMLMTEKLMMLSQFIKDHGGKRVKE